MESDRLKKLLSVDFSINLTQREKKIRSGAVESYREKLIANTMREKYGKERRTGNRALLRGA